jgi:hypothetical protein
MQTRFLVYEFKGYLFKLIKNAEGGNFCDSEVEIFAFEPTNSYEILQTFRLLNPLEPQSSTVDHAW